jgi:phosphoribosyl-ATP pyrophosphohydrolase
MNTDSYTGKMQRNPQLALAKIMEEFWEVISAHQDNQISECSDLFVHLIMYLNGMGISIEDVSNELNTRRWIPRSLIENNEILKPKSKEIIIGITTCKYTDKTDRFAEEQLGIKITRYSGRNYLVNGQIIDKKKFSKYFGNDETIQLSLFTCKPKDMIWLLASQRLTHIITFENVVKNYPKIYSVIHEIIDPSICLALICRQGESIEADKWTYENKSLIASENICQVTRFFEENNINHHTYHLDKITGSSEGFLINSDKYLLADAIVETGRTLEENHLQIWKIIIPKGQMHIGLYGRDT